VLAQSKEKKTAIGDGRSEISCVCVCVNFEERLQNHYLACRKYDFGFFNDICL
jgi:hypothetical protein